MLLEKKMPVTDPKKTQRELIPALCVSPLTNIGRVASLFPCQKWFNPLDATDITCMLTAGVFTHKCVCICEANCKLYLQHPHHFLRQWNVLFPSLCILLFHLQIWNLAWWVSLSRSERSQQTSACWSSLKWTNPKAMCNVTSGFRAVIPWLLWPRIKLIKHDLCLFFVFVNVSLLCTVLRLNLWVSIYISVFFHIIYAVWSFLTNLQALNVQNKFKNSFGSGRVRAWVEQKKNVPANIY